MTDKEIGKKVLEQAEESLSVKEIWERACEMGLDKECKDGKILSHSLGVLEVSLVNTTFLTMRSNFMLQTKKEDPIAIGSNLVKENFLHKKPQMLKKKMMDRASVQTQLKNKKPLLMKRKKRICTHCL
ncbi:winged helix-turn-helix domain-containing protein [Helicobacter pylori]|nr:winged helix-turn-helix domain-containing protein [Helicobacter pylori]